ncbi:MAG: chemotaxis protein CheD [Candidatus Omnitrophica bacterium]|nr:chemotaxis protein CheD [Candidatus Omnitrophota bacterium]
MSDSSAGKRLIVGIGDLKAGKSPDEIVTTLGSCIGIILYSAKPKVGGLLHIMMGYSSQSSKDGNFKKTKYADTGIAELLSVLKQEYGANPGDLAAKVFGGANVLQGITADIGAVNYSAARQVLESYKIPIVVTKVGGHKGYRISFKLETGEVLCQRLGEEARVY